MDAVGDLVVLLKELEFCSTGSHGSKVFPVDQPPELQETVIKMQIPETHPRPVDYQVCILSSILGNFNHSEV